MRKRAIVVGPVRFDEEIECLVDGVKGSLSGDKWIDRELKRRNERGGTKCRKITKNGKLYLTT